MKNTITTNLIYQVFCGSVFPYLLIAHFARGGLWVFKTNDCSFSKNYNT